MANRKTGKAPLRLTCFFNTGKAATIVRAPQTIKQARQIREVYAKEHTFVKAVLERKVDGRWQEVSQW